jgi:hypothetical protein
MAKDKKSDNIQTTHKAIPTETYEQGFHDGWTQRVNLEKDCAPLWLAEHTWKMLGAIHGAFLAEDDATGFHFIKVLFHFLAIYNGYTDDIEEMIELYTVHYNQPEEKKEV